ncbi:LRR receptor-like serine/threonine-protein kinase FLS2 [Durio zibethinus]|uniref:LRR receptor-like serine/threonine-protein kinase FLS2 n=1 Tax=Durio zibethinus TaxID=66656 RepID=A0A6P6BAM5_DURZI|nr:LRR receptor-like serine/threonine-protein kinase FLS2 [Durio zibethinus]
MRALFTTSAILRTCITIKNISLYLQVYDLKTIIGDFCSEPYLFYPSLLLLLSLSFSPAACEVCDPLDKEALLGFKRRITAEPYNCCNHGYLPLIAAPPGKSLKYLDLSENQKTGSIPKPIGGFSALEASFFNFGFISLNFFRISQNKLTGNLPPSLGELTNVQRLILENNKLTGKLPATTGHLVPLTEIYLSNNRFTGKMPSSFANLQNLQALDLSRNLLFGQITELTDIGSLFRLILAKTRIRGAAIINSSSLCDAPLPPCKHS